MIIRTNAEGKRVADLDAELKVLVKRWEDNIGKMLKVKTPSLIYEETGRTVALLRDIFNPSFEQIHVNDRGVSKQIADYVSIIAPDRKNIVKIIPARCQSSIISALQNRSNRSLEKLLLLKWCLPDY